MKKNIALILTFVLLFSLIASCSPAQNDTNNETTNPVSDQTSAEDTEPSIEPEEKIKASALTLAGPTGMGMAYLMSMDEEGTSSIDYTFSLFNNPDELAAEVIKGNYDFAALPVNLASVLYHKTDKQFSFLAVNTLGVLHIVENGNEIKSVEDLKGKTIYASGQGSTPEYIFNALLRSKGIDPEKDLTIEYVANHTELASMLIAGSVKLAVLPEPNVTSVLMQSSDLRKALDVTSEYKTSTGENIVQGCVIVRNEFAASNPGAVDNFISEYSESVSYVNSKATEASALIEKYGIVPKAAIAEKAIPGCNIVFFSGKEGSEAMKAMLKVLFDANPASVGGELPEDGFYYSK